MKAIRAHPHFASTRCLSLSAHVEQCLVSHVEPTVIRRSRRSIKIDHDVTVSYDSPLRFAHNLSWIVSKDTIMFHLQKSSPKLLVGWRLGVFLLLVCSPVMTQGVEQVAVPLSALQTRRGDHSTDQGLTALDTVEQDGSDNDWDTYVEFTAAKRGYEGLFDYRVPSTVDLAQVEALALQVNYLGTSADNAVWMWQIRNLVTRRWITLGTNQGASDWSAWVAFEFVLTTSHTLTDFVNANGLVSVRFKTSAKYEVCDLDLQRLVLNVGDSAPPPETAEPTPAPTVSPTTTKPTPSPTRPPFPSPTATPLAVTTTPTGPPSPSPTGAPLVTTPPTGPPSPSPTDAPLVTPAPTKPPSPAPTGAPLVTTPPTAPPSPSPTDAPPSPGTIWQPPPGTTWQWQISGTVDTSIEVSMYDIDLFDVPQSTIDQLHAQGRIVICYFSAGSYEDWRSDASDFSPALLGSPLGDWEGEWWLDIRQIENGIGPIMEARMDLAVAKQCDGVEPDNIDAYINNNGLGLTGDDQLVYNRWLAQQAHARGLSIGLKNDLDQVLDLVDDFDWALNEQCWQYQECDMLLPFVQAGKAVFGVEYSGYPSSFCPTLNAMDFSWLQKTFDLDAWVIDCRTF